jgi:hypothetical protein
MGEPVNLAVVKTERAEQDRTYSKQQLHQWVDELPDDITGFIVCATKHLDTGEVWSRVHGAGNSVLGRYEAQTIGTMDWIQFKGKKED